MPINNSQGVFNVGRDLQVVLQGPTGQLQLDNIMGFEAKQDTDVIKLKRLDGVILNAELPAGWSGSIDLERGSPATDLFFAQAETAWMSGGVFSASQIFTYITETDGSTSTFAYDNVALKLSDAGNWRGETSVKQRIDWVANRRRSV